MTIGSKEALGIRPTLAERAAFEKAYEQELKNILEKARRRGRINLVLRREGQAPRLYLVNHKGHTNPFLAKVFFASEITLEELTRRANPWEMMIFEKREADTEAVLIQIAKELPAFFRSFYPEVEGLPINIYDSGESFRVKKPLAVVNCSSIKLR